MTSVKYPNISCVYNLCEMSLQQLYLWILWYVHTAIYIYIWLLWNVQTLAMFLTSVKCPYCNYIYDFCEMSVQWLYIYMISLKSLQQLYIRLLWKVHSVAMFMTSVRSPYGSYVYVFCGVPLQYHILWSTFTVPYFVEYLHSTIFSHVTEFTLNSVLDKAV